MARTQRVRSQSSASDVYTAHAAQARQMMTAAGADHEAVTLFDHAAAAHETAARMLRHAGRLGDRAALYQAAANAARSKRPDIAVVYDGLAMEQLAAAATAKSRAAHHHGLGQEKMALGAARADTRRAADPDPEPQHADDEGESA